MRQPDTARSVAITDTETSLAPAAPSRRSWVSRIDWLAALLLSAGLGIRLWFIFRGWPTLDSDEAIVNLMARHILYNGEHPIFYYGQHYMGSLEAYLIVPFFWLMGANQVASRVAMLILILPFLLCVYLLGRAAYGRVVGLLALGALAIGPAYGLMREAPGIGGYQETLLFGALLSLLAYQRLRAPVAPTQRRADTMTIIAQYATFGLIAGLGVWSDELILAFIVAPLLALALARPRELFWPPVLSALITGFLVGGAPFIAYNVLQHGQTFVELSLQERSGHLGAHQLLAQIGSTLSIGIPATFGSPQVCVVPGSLYAGYASFPSIAVQMMGSSSCQLITDANLLFGLVILGVYVFAATPVLRAALAARPWRDWMRATRQDLATGGDALQAPTLPMRTVAGKKADPEQAARLWLRGILILAALGTVAEYSLSSRTVGTDQFVAVRYLIGLYITFPVVIGALWEAISPTMARLRSRGRDYVSARRAHLIACTAGKRLAGAAAGVLRGGRRRIREHRYGHQPLCPARDAGCSSDERAASPWDHDLLRRVLDVLQPGL